MSANLEDVTEVIDADIAIVGGGVAGSALAAALRDSDYKIVVIDKRTAPLDSSRGDNFTPANAEIFAKWGILDEFIKRGATKRVGAEFRTSAGEVLLTSSYSEIDIPEPYFLVYHHDLMAETFQEIASTNPNYHLLQPYSVKGFEIDAGSIKSITATSNEGKQIKVRAPLVVASDGSASIVRTALGFPTFEHPYQHNLVSIFAPYPKELIPQNYFYRYSDPSGHVIIQHRNNGTAKIIMAVGSEGMPWWKSATPEERAEFLARRAPILEGIETEMAGFYPARMIHALQYVSGNTVLIGDAAHTIHPARGQGLNMGISALPNLLAKLPSVAELKDPQKVREALLAFEAIQKPLYERSIARNHVAAMDMEAAAGENHEFVIKRQDEALRKVASTPAIRRRYLHESTGYPLAGAPVTNPDYQV